jgi:acetyl esterase/lipase
MRKLMDGKKIVIMNLSKGKIGEDSSRLLGGLLITKLQLAAMSRVDIPEEERNDWRVSPILADNLSNLPPCYIVTILSDILRDEGRDYVSKLKEAGNDVEHIEYENAVHGFISWPLNIKITEVKAVASHHKNKVNKSPA